MCLFYQVVKAIKALKFSEKFRSVDFVKTKLFHRFRSTIPNINSEINPSPPLTQTLQFFEGQSDQGVIQLVIKPSDIRGRSRAAATSKMERFVIIANG